MNRTTRTLLAVGAMLAVGLTYLLTQVIGIDPFHPPMTVTVELARTGGLLQTSPVSYRGYPVGRINEIRMRPGGVRVRVDIDQGTEIPVDTDVVIAALSAAGEQYLDFRPRTDRGPYLTDGAVVDQRQTRLPLPFTQVIADLVNLTDQVDPAQLTSVVTEMNHAFGGSAPDIQRIVDGGDVLLGGLESVLPNTVRALHSGRIVLGTANDLRPELADFAGHAKGFTGPLRATDPAFRQLLSDSPETLALLDDVVRSAGPSVTALLGDLGTVGHVVALRRPALSQILPGLSRLGPTLAGVVQEGKIHAVLDAYPHPTCDYHTPRRLATVGGEPAPRINRYCDQTGPWLQQRGSANVPRPPGDDTAGPPKGADPDRRARTGHDTGHR